MRRFYAFNGDADGLCALQQLRLADPRDATLVTGVKRDIKLLQRISAHAGDDITALDVSLDQNRTDLQRLLAEGASVRYFDHHYAGDRPEHSGLELHIDESADVCTSILVDRYLGGRYRAWAITAALGDNLADVAHDMARVAGMSSATMVVLEMLGTCLNYNAYGESIADLHIDPAELARHMLSFADPVDFATSSRIYARLAAGYHADMEQACLFLPAHQRAGVTVMVMPNAAWARRAMGVLANHRIREQPDHALAILSPKSEGGFSVSVRVPASAPASAADFCRAFETGGGRKLAGGINHLPDADVERFIANFDGCFSRH
ncbi:acetyltransferase [Herbaspirillum sp. GCM10030257]|uniref:acetyltransferase n=1 Tax=Herbaspirillum sp. GCM10030257 TaxID=3273393 RepID=UPI00361461D4